MSSNQKPFSLKDTKACQANPDCHHPAGQDDGSDNILIKHEKFSISFDFLFGKRFLSNEIRHSSFILILELIQPEIEAFLLHQIGMMTGFDNPAPVEHDDAIRMADGGQPVGDHQ
jgi:hypothetical protein